MINQHILELIEKHKFKVFPLHTINELNRCTCGDLKCGSAGKHPRIKMSWKICATDNINSISNWVSKYNNEINFALITGYYSQVSKKYLVVVDVDDCDYRLIKQFKKTFYYKTGSGGYHFWFWSDKKINNSVSLIDNKIDIRGTNGYVVIPPAKNKQGNYEFFSDSFNEILDLPKILKDKLEEQVEIKILSKQKKDSKSELNKEPKQQDSKSINYDFWLKLSIQEIKNKINSGEKIPLGIRNVILHKLISSDRAKGTKRNDLYELICQYKNCVEEPESFNEKELTNIVNSVKKYRQYNFHYDNVVDIFSSWLSKQKNIDEVYKYVNYEKLEEEFLETLSKEQFCGCKISDVINYRKDWYMRKNIFLFPNLQNQLLSKKLISLGFEKKKCEDGNYWNIKINKEGL